MVASLQRSGMTVGSAAEQTLIELPLGSPAVTPS